MNDQTTRGRFATSDEEDAMLRIFLNYRREDSSGHAGRLYDDLVERYDESEVFIDIDKIEPGLDFVEAIDNALEGCDVVLALIGKHWLTITDARGERRIDNPDDYVRLELEAALARGTRVIPVCVQGSEMPNSADLPEPLQSLARRHAIELSDKRWRHDVESLAAVLDRLAADRAERERLAHEAAESERLLREAEERERLAQIAAERERLAQDAAERERLAREASERERLAQEAAEREQLALEAAEPERHPLVDEPIRGGRASAERGQARARPEPLQHGLEVRRELEREPANEPNAAGATTAPISSPDGDSIVSATPTHGKASVLAAPQPAAVPQLPPRRGRPQAVSRRRLGALVAGALIVTGLGGAAAVMALGGEDGASTTSEAEGAPPSILSAPTIVGRFRAGNVVQATRGSWSNTPREFQFEWRRCNPGGSACRAIDRATGSSHTLGRPDVGRRVRVAVTARNGAGARTSVSVASRTVAAPFTRPRNAEPPRISGVARPGERLRASRGVWRGTRPVAFTYSWLRCSARGGGCEPITAGRSDTYAIVAADIGRTIRVRVRASNRAGNTSVTSHASRVVQSPAAPTEEPGDGSGGGSGEGGGSGGGDPVDPPPIP